MKDQDFKQFVLDQLGSLDDLHARAMFGGYGIYRGDSFFAIIFDGRLFFKTDPVTRETYIERGMKPFRPRPGQALGHYYEVPVDIVEDPTELVAWARAAATA